MSRNKKIDFAELASPLGFTKAVLRMSCYPWAERILIDLNQSGAIAVRAANGSGKTTHLAAPAALWHASVFAGSLCICSAGVFRQVKDILFPAIRAHAHKFSGWKFNECEIETHHGSRIIGFSTDDPGRFEGWHNDHLLVIIDEAKSVPDSIFEAVERCQPERLLLLSSPGGPSGYFYQAFHGRRKFFRQHTVTAYDCPHISPAWIAEQIEKYGEHNPLVRSMIFGEFMTMGEDDAVIPLGFIERCLANPPSYVDGPTQAFCDFAAGGDENVLAIRRGNKVEIAAAWRERDTMRATGRFIQLFREHKLRSGEIAADEGGLGLPICDRLAEEGWLVRRVNNGAPALDGQHYASIAAEIWHEGRIKIERQQIILPNDQQLIGQMSSRKAWPNSRGKMELESKQDLRARGLPSPDRADAVLGAIATGYVRKILVA